jgi:DNA polymerase III subunit alpha
MVNNFTHLWVQSHYSLLGGTAGVQALAAQAAANQLSHLALTDHNGLYGAVAFARACRAADVQPLIGMSINVAASLNEAVPYPEAPGRLVLLATGPAGYRSLCRLSAELQGSHERQKRLAYGLTWDALKEYSRGLICLSGGRLGWLERYLRAGNQVAAGRYVGRLGGLYGDNCFLSLEIHRPEDEVIAQETVQLAGRFGLAAVVAQPVYTLTAAERPHLHLLAAIDHNCRLADVPPTALPAWGDPDTDWHWLSPAEIARRYAAFPGALDQVGQIAARCEPALPDGRRLWPVLDLPDGQKPEAALQQLAAAGLQARYGEAAEPTIESRLQQELTAINEQGYAPLFLVVADIVRYARQTAVPVSTRGSVANSLVAYCTGISSVDPIAHDLLFERFLNPDRADPPDIDLDFCSRRRDEILAYVREKYGAEQVALVSTINTFQPKSAVRETAKALELDERRITDLVRQLPRRLHPDPRRRDRRTLVELAADLDDPQLADVLHAAQPLIDQPHHLSVHPGGLVITPGPLTDYVPVQWTAKQFLITQFDHRDVERLGLPKLDLLGIRALTVLAGAADLVRRDHDPNFRLEAIPSDDPATGEILARGETIGVFQCESAGAQRTLRQLQAQSVGDLAAANAFFKPGPATGGMAAAFIRRYRGQEEVAFLHPALEPILAPTQGILLFQEQILRVATEIAGLSWAEADHLRRGMSKFQAEEMATMQSRFITGCTRPAPDGPGLTAVQAETLWEQVIAFAGYGFNQGHATAYAGVSYHSAYLKAHYPAAFLAARLAYRGGFHHPAIYMAEAQRLGIEIRPPHVNHSDYGFALGQMMDDGRWTLDDGRCVVNGPPSIVHRPVLWMGLGQVRSLRRRSTEQIIARREERPFTSLRQLVERVSLQSKELTHLIQCGALDGLAQSRAALLAEAERMALSGSAGQMAFDFFQPAVTAETAADRLQWERRVLGLPVSVTPLALLPNLPDECKSLAEVCRSRGRVTFAGYRLPGRTGGRGFFLSDGRSYLVAQLDESLPIPRSWQPVVGNGRWQEDEWGGGWLQIRAYRADKR